MKKLVLIAVLTVSVLNLVSAQNNYKPSAGDFTLEVGFSPFSSTGNIIDGGELTGFYNFTDRLALSLGLGFNYGSQFFNNGETGDATRKNSTSGLTFNLQPGVVYFLSGTARLAPYVGAGLGISYTSNSAKEEAGTQTAKVTNRSGSNFAFGVGASVGFNYFFAEHLYIGADLGLQFANVSVPNEKVVYSGQGAPSSPAESKNKQGAFQVGISAMPQLRLGWTL
ncbi:MAG: porin family protein [Prevotellaceae bacterium]|jgi:hypothetical protein|nr:porin family protein [Prevotellaceae bacterium]